MRVLEYDGAHDRLSTVASWVHPAEVWDVACCPGQPQTFITVHSRGGWYYTSVQGRARPSERVIGSGIHWCASVGCVHSIDHSTQQGWMVCGAANSYHMCTVEGIVMSGCRPLSQCIAQGVWTATDLGHTAQQRWVVCKALDGHHKSTARVNASSRSKGSGMWGHSTSVRSTQARPRCCIRTVLVVGCLSICCTCSWGVRCYLVADRRGTGTTHTCSTAET